MNSKTDEKLAYVHSTHWVKYMHMFVFCHVFLLAGVAVTGIALGPAHNLGLFSLVLYATGSVIILIAHHVFFHKLFSEEMDDIIITNERIIYFNDNLFFCDDEHEIPLQKIASVDVQQRGLFQNVLNYGTLWFDTGGGSGSDLRRSIPQVRKPDEVVDVVTGLLEG